MVTTKYKDLLAVVCILSSVIIFFFPLFYPKPSIIFTPEIYDSYHLSYSQKFLLWESLQKNTLPLWSRKIGNGFPVLGEGQTGIFYLPNLILFKFLDHFTAYNLSIAFSILLVGLGMYCYLRLLRIGPFLSLIGSLTLMYSGLYMTRLSHLTLLQGFSLLPLIIAMTYQLILKPSYKHIVILAFALTQQFFTGFPQASFITILYAGSLILWHRKTHKNIIGLFLLSLILTLGLSAIQLLPSIEFLRQTITPSTLLSDNFSQFGYALKDILMFVYPYILGFPLDGTYAFSQSNTIRIFWENNAYIGAIFLFGFSYFIWLKNRNKTLKQFTQYHIFMLALSFLLLFGKDSPLVFILSFWPFNLFRVASRFLFIFTHILIVFNIYFIQSIMQKFKNYWFRFGMLTLLILNCIHLFTIWGPMHIRLPKSIWLDKPEFAKYISDDNPIKQFNTDVLYYQLFMSKKPWKDKQEMYLFLKNVLNADSNVLWNIYSDSAYPSRMLLATTRKDYLIQQASDYTESFLTIKPIAKNVIDINNIGYLLSTKPILAENIQLIVTTNYKQYTLYLYKNIALRPRIYFADSIYQANTLDDVKQILDSDKKNLSSKSVIVSSLKDAIQSSRNSIDIILNSEYKLILQTYANNNGILVVSDTFYPGWYASIDGKTTTINQANINQRAIHIQKGKHIVEFAYRPLSLIFGIILSSISLLCCIWLILLNSKKNNLQK